ncbi:hypothetical protein SESBI_42883 [Sesbania bispinosa]|nr:hypothetical protein SESBI_42883 [Sesbania bispinosa]
MNAVMLFCCSCVCCSLPAVLCSCVPLLAACCSAAPASPALCLLFSLLICCSLTWCSAAPASPVSCCGSELLRMIADDVMRILSDTACCLML